LSRDDTALKVKVTPGFLITRTESEATPPSARNLATLFPSESEFEVDGEPRIGQFFGRSMNLWRGGLFAGVAAWRFRDGRCWPFCFGHSRRSLWTGWTGRGV